MLRLTAISLAIFLAVICGLLLVEPQVSSHSGEGKPLAKSFAALRLPQHRLPGRLMQTLARNFARSKVQPRFTTGHFSSTYGGGGIWVTKQHKMLCIIHASSAAISCSTMRDALRAGVSLGIGIGNEHGRPTQFLVIGIVPDWIKAVRLRPLGGRAVTIATANGTYALGGKKLIRVEELITN